MKFARWTFLIAAIYGFIVLLPQYFLIEKAGIDAPPAINHHEYYYGFIGLAASFQIAFLLIASDPLRYRPIILAAIVEKFSFGLATIILFARGMVAGPIILGAGLDLVLGILFIICYVKLSRDPGA
ncbi:MAG TPA: hypothetical protein VJL58_05110 [Pyrinomonadaceae bacterium]|nr:hypothetical protein [Pyrinomonadaceae bacterium]